jgi:hypothetical protein
MILKNFRRENMAIKRIWHGLTTKENAGKYQELLKKEVWSH